jgi:hypothetical protein
LPLFLVKSKSWRNVCKGPLPISTPIDLCDKSTISLDDTFLISVSIQKLSNSATWSFFKLLCFSLHEMRHSPSIVSLNHHTNLYIPQRTFQNCQNAFSLLFVCVVSAIKLYDCHLSVSLVATDVLQLQNRLKIIKTFGK